MPAQNISPGASVDVQDREAGYEDEPAVAEEAARQLEGASADGRLGEAVLREDDAQLVADVEDLELDEETWLRTGRVATVEAVTGGDPYTVWLVLVGEEWQISHTTEGAP